MNDDLSEFSLKGTKGFLIRCWVGAANGEDLRLVYKFRVYHDHGGFTDFDLMHGDIEIEIVGDDVHAFTGDEFNYIDYPSLAFEP